MNLKVFTVPLDIKQPTSASDEWVVVAGDNGNEIHVVLTDDGNPIDLSGKTILAIFSKPDGSTSEQDSWGNGVTVSGEDNNVVVIDLWPSSFGTGRLHIGLVKCEIQVYYGDSLENLVTSANFTFKVRRAILNNETVEQTSEYPILSELIRQVTEIGQGIQPDWEQDDPTKSGYIKNKPFIPENASDIGALPDTTTPADIGALPDTATPADIGAEKARLQFTDTAVLAAAFIEDATYEDFPYRAAVALEDVTADMTPEVVFAVTEATSGIFAPVAEAYDGGVYIYASEAPEAEIAIPTIICWKGVLA